MKQIIIIFLVLPICSFGQTIEILISDFETNEPLPFANIFFKNSGVGNSTNRDGYASFRQADLLNKDSIVVSYIGYDKQTQFYSRNNNILSPIEINLMASTQLLTEVVVTYVEPPTPEKIIKRAIKNISANYSKTPVTYRSLYRETIEENGTFIQLNEAVVKTFYTGYPQKKLDRKIWEDWYYDESYAFELEGNRYFYPLLKDFNTKEDQQTIVASRHSSDWSAYGMETTLIGDPLLLFALDKIKYQYDFFNPSVLSKYHLKHEQSEIISNEECFVISFYPKSTNRKFIIDQSKKNKSAIYIGRMYMSKESYALLKFEYKLAVERNFGFFEKSMPLDYQVEMNYEKSQGTYHIKNIKFSETRKVGKTDNDVAILHKALKELSIFGVETENVQPIDDDVKFKSTRFSSIRYYPKNYNPEYWNTIELPASLKPNGKLVADLEVNRPLYEQFSSFKQEQTQDLPKPEAFKQHYSFDYHNTAVVDSLHWMAFPNYEEKFIMYLAEENKYAKNALIKDRKYQKSLFEELNTFYAQQTDEKRVIKPGMYFLEEDSLGNEIFYYQEDSTNRVEVFNLSLFDSKHKNSYIKRLLPNPSKNKIIVVVEKAGMAGAVASVFPFGGNTPTDSISNIYTIQWYSDREILYTKTNDIGSARSLHFYDIKTETDSVIYTESDPKFDVEVIRVKNHLFCTVQSKTENEIYWINKDASYPEMELIKKRKAGVLVDVKIGDGIYLLVNDENNGSSIEYCAFQNTNNPTPYITAHKEDYILDMIPMHNKIIALVYEKSVPKLKYITSGEEKWKALDVNLGIGDYLFISADSTMNSITFSFSSPSHPYSIHEYNFSTSTLKTVSTRDLTNPTYYKYTAVKRIWARSHDKTKIPITIVKNRASKKSNAGLILKVYGAYGAITTPAFDAQDAILLGQGYTIAYAHVRGGSILGSAWYKSGREFQKENSVLDYIACAEYLIEKEYTSSLLLIGYGNSAGGLVVGQAINLKPELFNTVILDHPYLDVINTMMNDTLPLTIDEYKEWGNPQNKEVYDYIMRYSPYHNIRPQQYPNVLLIGSYQDYQTPIWQIAKYTSKLRENNLSDSEIIMLSDMNSGHTGNTTGKEWMKLFAETFSFAKLKNKEPVPNKTYKQ